MKALILSTLLLLTSCADLRPGTQSIDENKTTENLPNQMPGQYGHLPSQNLKKDFEAYLDEDDDIGDGKYRLYTVTFKNSSRDWKRIKSAKFEFKNKKLNEEAKILIGSDLETWLESMTREQSINEYNKHLVLGSLAFLTLIGGAASNNGSLVAVGAGAYAGWVGVAAYDIKRTQEIQKQVPKDHLFSEFSVPPSLTSQKWIAVEYHGDEDTSAPKITVTFIDGETQTFKF